MRLRARWVSALLGCSLQCFAQQPTDSTPAAAPDRPSSTGTVTGHVFLEDTKGPARKATVYLQPAAALQSNEPRDRTSGQTRDDVTIAKETSFDGSFSFDHVPYGAYYVMASQPGYISPYVTLALAEGRSQYGPQRELGPAEAKAKEVVLRSIPRVTVQSDQPVSAEITLERGGAVSGNISYDDGTPAVGLEVSVLSSTHRDGKETWETLQSPPNTRLGEGPTDDRGFYRFSGLPNRKYVVLVTLDLSERVSYISSHESTGAATNSSSQLTFYSGNTPRLKDASSFIVHLGEERNGEDIRIPMSKLHKISGYIVSAHDHHVINAGQVDLLSADDHSIAAYASTTANTSEFVLNFVFDGDYILTSPTSMDVEYQPLPQQPDSHSPPVYESHPKHLYGSAGIPLHVSGDMDGVTLPVPEPTAREAQEFAEAYKQEQQTHTAH